MDISSKSLLFMDLIIQTRVWYLKGISKHGYKSKNYLKEYKKWLTYPLLTNLRLMVGFIKISWSAIVATKVIGYLLLTLLQLPSWPWRLFAFFCPDVIENGVHHYSFLVWLLLLSVYTSLSLSFFCVCACNHKNHTYCHHTYFSHRSYFSPVQSWIEDSFTLARLLTTARLREISSGSISRNHEIHRNCSDPDKGIALFRVGGFVAIVPLVSLHAATRGRLR